MILNFNLTPLPYPVSVQESDVSLQRTAREEGAQPETRRRKHKKEKKLRTKNQKNRLRNPKNPKTNDHKR